jgi:DNA-binding helix-hairpin-helix protein with protein kinase domain
MEKYIIAEVNTENQIINRGELLLDPELLGIVGSGSTGDVYAIYEYQIQSPFLLPETEDVEFATRYVAKIWRSLPIVDEQVDKLRYMVRNKLTYKSNSGIVWPEFLLLTPHTESDTGATHAGDVIYRNDMVVGYIMPRVMGAFPLYKLIDPEERALLLSVEYKDTRFLYHVAINIARAFYALHKQYHVMGDTNPTNMLVTPYGEVKLIDCDSFQIQRNLNEYYPANKQSSSSKSILDVSVANDLGNLASLIFQLLMQGAHPFVGRNSNGIVDSTILRAQRIFPYIHPTHTPLEGNPSIACLPNEVQELCVHAFTNQPQNPPSAVTWVKTLNTLKTQLIPCTVNPDHYHIDGLPCAECEWQKQRPTTHQDA